MFRSVFAIALLGLGATAALAVTDPIAVRKAAMKAIGEQTRVGAAMNRGEAPFDLAKAQAIFATYLESAEKSHALYPDSAKTGGDTAADPKIWNNKADFESKMRKFATDAKAAAAAVTDLDSFKASFRTVMQNCGGCHETYRMRRS